MRVKSLSILSLLFITWFVAGCSGGGGTGAPETVTLRDKKVSFASPPKDWKRTERKSDPTDEVKMTGDQILAVEYTPPTEGYLLVSNLGYSDVKDRADELHDIIAVLKKEGATQEIYNRVVRLLDESGSAGLLEYVDEKTGKISNEKSNDLHEELSQAEKALNVPKGNQPKVAVALKHLEVAAKKCDDGWKKPEVDLIETGRVLNAVSKRGGKVIKQDEIKVDGQRAAWIEYEAGEERGIHVLFMKDNNLYSIALNVPSKGFSDGAKVTKAVVDSFKVQ